MEQTSPNTELHTSPIYGNKRFLILILCKCFGDDVKSAHKSAREKKVLTLAETINMQIFYLSSLMMQELFL